MKRNSKKILLYIALFTSAVAIYSCKKDDSDFSSLVKNLQGVTNSYIEEGLSVNLNGQDFSSTHKFIGVAVSLSKTTNQADTVEASIEPSLIAEYNQYYSENNPEIPDSAFSVSNNGKYAIKAGKSSSTDSLYVTLINGTQLKDSGVYLVPVKLKSKNGNSVSPSIIFFKMVVHKSILTASFETSDNQGITGNIYNGGLLFWGFVIGSATPVLPFENPYKIGVKLSSIFTFHDLKVSAVIYNNDSAASKINPSSTDAYTSFPDDAIQFTKSTVTIPAGSLHSQDSLTFSFDNTSKKFKSGNQYALTLVLQPFADENYRVPLVDSLSKAYYTMSLFLY